MPSQQIQLDRSIRDRQAIGGSAMSLNKLPEQMPLSSRNASSIPDLATTTVSPTNGNDQHNNKLTDELKTINSNTEPATIRSKFTPGNIFKNFFK